MTNPFPLGEFMQPAPALLFSIQLRGWEWGGALTGQKGGGNCPSPRSHPSYHSTGRRASSPVSLSMYAHHHLRVEQPASHGLGMPSPRQPGEEQDEGSDPRRAVHTNKPEATWKLAGGSHREKSSNTRK